MIQLQNLDLERPSSFYSPPLAALRLLYKEACLKDEKPCSHVAENQDTPANSPSQLGTCQTCT